MAWWWWWCWLLQGVCASKDKKGDKGGGDDCGSPPCKSGCYLLDDQARFCVVTPAGGYSPANANSLYVCEAGTFSKRGYGKCFACPSGAHSRDEGSVSCEPCPAATYTPAPGFRECLACNSALYSGWGSDRVLAFAGQVFCQRPGSTNQFLSLAPTLAPLGTPIVTLYPTLKGSPSPSRSPRPTLPPQRHPSWPSPPSKSPTSSPMATTGPSSSNETSLMPTTTTSRPTESKPTDNTTLYPSLSNSYHFPSASPYGSVPAVPTTNFTAAPTNFTAAPTVLLATTLPTKQPLTSAPTTTTERNASRFRTTFYRVLPVFSAALLITMLACCIRSSKKRETTPKEAAILPKSEASNEGSRGDASSVGDVYIDDEYDEVLASVELGSTGAPSSIVSEQS
jgi:Tyrosine-protein kinase ephrin type A/B receptor-like